jgi:hypothetical protein
LAKTTDIVELTERFPCVFIAGIDSLDAGEMENSRGHPFGVVV